MNSSSLKELLQENKIIATLGICKNAGKTTVLNYLVERSYDNLIIGITSIGYDGEETDAITLLPKPRILVHPNMLVATSESCLNKTEVSYEILVDPNMNTSIGKIYIVRIESKGYIEISGPNIRSDLSNISNIMLELGCNQIILDGAAGRLSFGTLADACVLSVGAAVSGDMNKVLNQSLLFIELLQLPTCLKRHELASIEHEPYTFCSIEDKNYVSVRGALVDKDLQVIMAICESKQIKTIEVLVNDAASVFITKKIWNRFKAKGGTLSVRNEILLKAITINPMSPYGEWFDEKEFKKRMEVITNLPIYNVMNED